MKEKGCTDVIFYSDSYHLDTDKASKLQALCGDFGLDVHVFEWHYPGEQFGAGYVPPTTFKIIGSGYKQLYRGKLVGFYIGACKTVVESRPKQFQHRFLEV